MSTFAELPPQLFLLGNVMRTGLILGGTSYLQDMLLPMNLSDTWLAPLLDKLESVKRQGWLVNDVYALQNLMESFLDFKPLTPELHKIRIPTMILNGEFDFLTPRPFARHPAHPYPGQRAGHHSARLSCLHSGKIRFDRGFAGEVRGRCDGEAVEGRRFGVDRARGGRRYHRTLS